MTVPGRSRGVGVTRTLTGRTVLVTGLVAIVAVLITAVVAIPAASRAANEDARRALADKARIAARALSAALDAPAAEPQRAEARIRALVQELSTDGVEVVVIRNGRADRPGLPPRIVAEVAAGRPVSQQVVWDSQLVLAEGRPASATATESASRAGIVLLAPRSVPVRTLLGRLWLALVAGLVAGVLAGALLARRLGRPLREAAAAARRISAGDRTVRLVPSSPTPDEVADVSWALNDLATALATSENRQRTFLTSISHELRTPLTTMRGYAEALADGVIDGDRVGQAGATMLAETQRLDRLVEDLLALARLEADDFPLEPVRVDLAALATDAAVSWRPRCEAVGVSLRIEVPDHPVPAVTDPGRVRQVLDGLLENALRVVPPGAPIVIAVGHDGTAASLQVRDGGPGLGDADLAVIFERGVAHERYKGVRAVGSGLGLALAQRLVARLGGRIAPGHSPEGGVQMTVLLPGS